jgi:predicted alpha-1,2-mannosidase
MKAYVYGLFDAPVTAKTEARGGKTRLAVSTKKNSLEFRYGISFISVEQAKANLEHEIPAWGFEKIKTQAKEIWNQRLGQIQVTGGTEAQRRVFYTALYRCSERMVNITEDGRYYSAYDHKVHEDARPFYVDNWLWDTFRALEPLQTLLNPQREADKIQSYVRMYEQSDWMPTFAIVWGNQPCMNGNHAAIWFTDAWFKGVRDFDVRAAYAGVKKNSLEGTKLPWRAGPKCALDDFYNTHGYMPALKPGEKETEPMVHDFEKRQPVAVTLENSYDDWAIAQLAGPAGKPEDRDLFLKRGQFYKNVFRADKGLAWPKSADGNWIEPLNPKLDGGPGYRNYYDENNGWTYTWDAPQDYEGLFTLMGGRQQALANLEQLFREPLGTKKNLFQVDGGNSTGMVGQFSMGNEPSFTIPYVFNRLGAPWKTQQHIRTLLEAFFTDGYSGIPGDEDGGGMSAFVVFSMMGFYPVTPGLPIYDVGSPVFEKTVITLTNGKKFTIIAKGASRENQYVQSIRLNGKPLNQVWFRHADIANGGTLELEMGDTPNRTLGVEASTFPPASLASDPAVLAIPN